MKSCAFVGDTESLFVLRFMAWIPFSDRRDFTPVEKTFLLRTKNIVIIKILELRRRLVR